MSETVLFLAHAEDTTLSKSSLETLKAAHDAAVGLQAPLDMGLIGPTAAAIAETLATCGARKVLTVSGDAFKTARYVSDAAAAAALIEASGATIVLCPATSRWSRVIAGVAQRVGGSIDTQVTEFAVAGGALKVTRWYYRQRMKGTTTRTTRPWLMSIAPGCFSPCELGGSAQAAPIEAIDVVLAEGSVKTTVLGVRASAADEQTIRPEAETLLVAGAGWTKKQADGNVHAGDAERLILGFLEKTKGSLGSSKSLVDLGSEGQAVLPFLTHLHQIGQTGATPRHRKGLATCCHGEEPHAVGWRFVNERRAINLDGNCGWAQGKADVLYVADAFAVMEKVNALLAES